MGLVRQSSFALLAVTAVVTSLVFLYPGSSAAATTVTLGPAGISAIDNGPDTDPSTAADNFFDLTFTIDLAAGEHIPLNYAEVRVAPAGTALVAGELAGTVCLATSAGTPSAQITAVAGASASTGPFVGTGYEVQASGYGFVFANPSAVDFSGYNAGTGYGYGGDTPGPDVLTVKVRVTGCVLAFNGVTHLAEVRVQAFVGATSGTGFWSTPVDTSFFDPAYVSAVDLTGTIALTGTTVTNGGEVGFEFDVGVDNIDQGATVTLDLDSLNAGNLGGTVTLDPEADLPAGTRITLAFFDVVSDPSVDDDTSLLNNPPFGINPTALLTQSGSPPAGFFVLQIDVPGVADADENTFLTSVTITLNIPQTYFTAQGLTPINGALRLRAIGFDSTSGDLDSINGPVLVDCTSVAGFCRVGFTISQFSAFALVIGTGAGGGGGGGGGSPVIVTTSPTTAPSVSVTGTPPVTTTVSPGPGDGSPGTGGDGGDGDGDGGQDDDKPNGIPGPAPVVLVGLLAAAALLARRKLL